MPSSDAITIPKVLKLVQGFSPHSILDVGCGNGKYGFLFREVLDLNYGRFKKPGWKTIIDGVEIETNYLNAIHGYFYNTVFWEDWASINLEYQYDLVFMGDILEHFEDGVWEGVLEKSMNQGKVVICVCPNWDGSINQGPVFGNESEQHRTVLSPSRIGGKCVWANTKAFITVHGNVEIDRDVLV